MKCPQCQKGDMKLAFNSDGEHFFECDECSYSTN